jgi:3-phosphoglycerate kinase
MKMTLGDLPDDRYAGNCVFVRVDFNVTIENGQVREDYRLRRSIPTIEYLSQRGAKVILASHLGRPKGKPVSGLSLRPVAQRLATMLNGTELRFMNDFSCESVKKGVDELKAGGVLLLENLRFHSGEEANDPIFAKYLASLADLYVNDAFGTIHRMHASTYGAAMLFRERLAGFLVQKELEVLDKIRYHPVRPFIVIVGGIKIKDKLSALKTLIPIADRILLGGGISYTFLAAQGMEIGNSPVEPDFLPWASQMLSEYGKKILLPLDHIIAMDLEKPEGLQIIHGPIPEGYKGLDIGRETVLAYSHEIMDGKRTIFWNGPLGAFEVDEFADGTVEIARAIALARWRGAMTVIGGGDTVAALRKAEVLETEVTHVSTGGGASLRYIGGEDLPGIVVLTDKETDLRTK